MMNLRDCRRDFGRLSSACIAVVAVETGWGGQSTVLEGPHVSTIPDPLNDRILTCRLAWALEQDPAHLAGDKNKTGMAQSCKYIEN